MSVYLKSLTRAGYTVGFEHSDRHLFSENYSVDIVVWDKDRNEVFRLNQNHNGRGGESIGALFQHAAYALKTVGLKPPMPVGAEPEIVMEDGMHAKTIYRHESFGMAQFCRYEGGRSWIFGSPIPVSGGISFTVGYGELHHDNSLNRDWYHDNGKRLIEICFTHAQFAELITGMNAKTVPCSIRWAEGRTTDLAIPPIYEDRQAAMVKQELTEELEGLRELREEVAAMVSDPPQEHQEDQGTRHPVRQDAQQVSDVS